MLKILVLFQAFALAGDHAGTRAAPAVEEVCSTQTRDGDGLAVKILLNAIARRVALGEKYDRERTFREATKEAQKKFVTTISDLRRAAVKDGEAAELLLRETRIADISALRATIHTVATDVGNPTEADAQIDGVVSVALQPLMSRAEKEFFDRFQKSADYPTAMRVARAEAKQLSARAKEAAARGDEEEARRLNDEKFEINLLVSLPEEIFTSRAFYRAALAGEDAPIPKALAKAFGADKALHADISRLMKLADLKSRISDSRDAAFRAKRERGETVAALAEQRKKDVKIDRLLAPGGVTSDVVIVCTKTDGRLDTVSAFRGKPKFRRTGIMVLSVEGPRDGSRREQKAADKRAEAEAAKWLDDPEDASGESLYCSSKPTASPSRAK